MSTRQDYVVVIGGGKNSVLVINKIHELGLKAIVADRDRDAPGVICADKKILHSTYESKPIIDELIRFQDDRKKIVAVVTRSSGIPVITTAEVAESLNLPGAGVESARILTYKHSLTECCLKHNIPTAEGRLLDFKKRKQVLDYMPCVVKPTLGLVGKKGVTLIVDKTDIGSAVDSAREASLDGNVLIEKYIHGIDASLISIVYDSSLYPCFFLRELNDFDSRGQVVSNGFCFSAELDKAKRDAMVEVAKTIVKAVSVKFSPFLISFRLTEDGKVIPIEVNLDFGGENVLDKIAPAKIDFDFIKCYLESIIHKTKPNIPKNLY
jgi:biotin carboxylase